MMLLLTAITSFGPHTRNRKLNYKTWRPTSGNLSTTRQRQPQLFLIEGHSHREQQDLPASFLSKQLLNHLMVEI